MLKWVKSLLGEYVRQWVEDEFRRGISAVRPGTLAAAHAAVARAAVELRKTEHARMHEFADLLYGAQCALGGMVPLERQAMAMQQASVENSRLKFMLIENARYHKAALLHLVRLLPPDDVNAKAYAHGAARLASEIEVAEKTWC